MMNCYFPTADQKERLFGYVFLFAQMLIIPLVVVFIVSLFGITSVSVQNFLYFSLNFSLAVSLFLRFWIRSAKDLLQRSLLILRTAATYFGVYYLCTILINYLIFSLDPQFSNANDSTIAAIGAEYKLIISICVVFFVPPAEELLFRGFVFGRLYPRYPILAYVLSALTFSAIHIIGYIGSVPSFRLILSLLQYIPVSICLARSYVESRNIFTPILIHSVINLIAVLSM